jgi:hypothetical protein
MKIKLRVIHSISGRARIKVDSQFDPKVFFLVLEAGLREVKAVRKADLNPYSQSITLFFRKDLDVELILRDLKRVLTDITSNPEFPNRIEDIKEAMTYGDRNRMEVAVRDKILTVSENLDRTVKHMSGNTVDMRTAVPVSSFAAGIGFLVLAPGLATPAWLVLLTFGITSFHLLKHDYREAEVSVDPLLHRSPDAEPMKLLEKAPPEVSETC